MGAPWTKAVVIDWWEGRLTRSEGTSSVGSSIKGPCREGGDRNRDVTAEARQVQCGVLTAGCVQARPCAGGNDPSEETGGSKRTGSAAGGASPNQGLRWVHRRLPTGREGVHPRRGAGVAAHLMVEEMERVVSIPSVSVLDWVQKAWAARTLRGHWCGPGDISLWFFMLLISCSHLPFCD